MPDNYGRREEKEGASTFSMYASKGGERDWMSFNDLINWNVLKRKHGWVGGRTVI